MMAIASQLIPRAAGSENQSANLNEANRIAAENMAMSASSIPNWARLPESFWARPLCERCAAKNTEPRTMPASKKSRNKAVPSNRTVHLEARHHANGHPYAVP